MVKVVEHEIDAFEVGKRVERIWPLGECVDVQIEHGEGSEQVKVFGSAIEAEFAEFESVKTRERGRAERRGDVARDRSVSS